MNNILIFLLYLALPFGSLEGKGANQDSLVPSAQQIKYDASKDLAVPQLDEQILQNFKESSEFDYSEQHEGENWWQKFKNWLRELWMQFWEWLLGDYQPGGWVTFLIKTLPYLILASIVVFVVWLFYKLNPGATIFGPRAKPEIFYSEEEEIIRTRNIQELIEKALGKRKYRMAIRYYYLFVLQKMDEAELISYKADKTNSEYFSEINSGAIRSGFQKATKLYDHVWYGNFEVTEMDFIKAESIFSSLKGLISSSNA